MTNDQKFEEAYDDEILACLKRIRRSIQLWIREGGRQGYLNFVCQFIP